MRSSWSNKLSIIFRPRLPVSWLFLCAISLVALITVLRTSHDSVSFSPVSDAYSNYKRIKEQAAVEYLDLRSVLLGRQKELSLCSKERENFVPCYNMSGNMMAGFKEEERFDRHCELTFQTVRCLVCPPKDYKIPLRWPAGRDVIWSGNVKITKDQFLSSGSMTKRLMLLEENQIAFNSDDGLIFDAVKDYSHQLAEMIGLGSETEFPQAGVHTVLDINCGFGSFGAHLLSLKVMTVCIAAYEATGSQVQLSLERGLPAMIGSFITRQLPYPSLSYGMIHCAQCGIIWEDKGGIFLLEVDRVLKPGGYFVLTSPTSKSHGSKMSRRKRNVLQPVEELTEQLCWTLLAQQDETVVWQKTSDVECYKSRQYGAIPLCKDAKGEKDARLYYQPLVSCISGTTSKRWIPIQNRSSGSDFNSSELQIHGVQPEEIYEDLEIWRLALENYWPLLTPLIFSDHPKRPGDEDPLPPYNMIRNVMDMNAKYGSLNAAFIEEGKSVWVMNVVPAKAPNTLPLILDRGFSGVFHDWCEPFPTYPRTYDMLHANGLLSYLSSDSCGMVDLFLEMDRILRPEGWVILRDKMGAIEMARSLAFLMRWEARVIDLQNGSDLRLLVCQKQFVKK